MVSFSPLYFRSFALLIPFVYSCVHGSLFIFIRRLAKLIYVCLFVNAVDAIDDLQKSTIKSRI